MNTIEFYKYGVNAYVVKPVSFSAFMKAVNLPGVFWGGINETPPPLAEAQETPRPKIDPLENRQMHAANVKW